MLLLNRATASRRRGDSGDVDSSGGWFGSSRDSNDCESEDSSSCDGDGD